jgi:hypothetical protein
MVPGAGALSYVRHTSKDAVHCRRAKPSGEETVGAALQPSNYKYLVDAMQKG